MKSYKVKIIVDHEHIRSIIANYRNRLSPDDLRAMVASEMKRTMKLVRRADLKIVHP